MAMGLVLKHQEKGSGVEMVLVSVRELAMEVPWD